MRSKMIQAGVNRGVRVRVRWSEHKGYVMMQNPLDGHVHIVEAKGLPRWVFGRLEGAARATGAKPKGGLEL